MSVFDVPDRVGCTVRRSSTNTPLQALATLNDEQFLECAKLMAVRALREGSTDRERLVMLFRRTTGRHPEPADLRTLEQGLSALARAVSGGAGRRGRSCSLGLKTCARRPRPGGTGRLDARGQRGFEPG